MWYWTTFTFSAVQIMIQFYIEWHLYKHGVNTIYWLLTANHFTDKTQMHQLEFKCYRTAIVGFPHGNWMMGERGQREKMLGAQCFSFSLTGS